GHHGVERRVPELAVVLEPPGRFPEWLGPETEPVLAPANAAAHQAGPLQHLHVLRDPVERDGEAAREAADVELAPRQDPEDGPAGRVGDGRVDPAQSGRCLRGTWPERRYHSPEPEDIIDG